MILIETLPGMTTSDYHRMLSWMRDKAADAFLGRVGGGELVPVPLETELVNMAATRSANPHGGVRERVLAIAGRPVVAALAAMFPGRIRVRDALESSRVRAFGSRDAAVDETGEVLLTAREGMLNEDYAAALGWLQANAPEAFVGEVRFDGSVGPWPLHHKLRQAAGDAREFPGEGRRSARLVLAGQAAADALCRLWPHDLSWEPAPSQESTPSGPRP